jgi:glutathione reductase (NADPH)
MNPIMMRTSHALCGRRAVALQHPRHTLCRQQQRRSVRVAASSDADDAAFDYDVFVIGGGSGGVRAARTAASHGEREDAAPTAGAQAARHPGMRRPLSQLHTDAYAGVKVALAELPMGFLARPDKGGVGGTCVLRGCVPKKLFLYASEFATEATASQGFG